MKTTVGFNDTGVNQLHKDHQKTSQLNTLQKPEQKKMKEPNSTKKLLQEQEDETQKPVVVSGFSRAYF